MVSEKRLLGDPSILEEKLSPYPKPVWRKYAKISKVPNVNRACASTDYASVETINTVV